MHKQAASAGASLISVAPAVQPNGLQLSCEGRAGRALQAWVYQQITSLCQPVCVP